jgi:hypothetical protein
VAVDWDGTLVDAKTQEWLPGSVHALGVLLARCRTIIVHTCHANWPEGRAAVEAKLEEVVARPWTTSLGERLRVEPKPAADFYIGDNYLHHGGDWSETLEAVGL